MNLSNVTVRTKLTLAFVMLAAMIAGAIHPIDHRFRREDAPVHPLRLDRGRSLSAASTLVQCRQTQHKILDLSPRY